MNINSNSEQKVDLDYILDKGVADYSDGDIVIFEQIGDKSLNGSVKLEDRKSTRLNSSHP